MDLPFNLYTFLRDSSLVMLAWFFLASSFFIWGKNFAGLFKIKISGNKGIIANIWLGWCVCVFLFSVYHLFLPIDKFASGLFYFPGIIIFIFKYAKKLPEFIKGISWLNLIVIIMTLTLASFVAIQLPANLDTGLYHLNTVRWANEYHIIKGLGNVHGQLGFNQLSFMYSASLNFHPLLNDYAFHVSNSFLYALFFIGMILNGTFIDLLLICLFFFIPMPYHWLNCLTPDIVSTIVQIIIFRFLIDILVIQPNNNDKSDYIAFSAIMSALLITIKLSNAIYVIGLGAVTFLYSKKYLLNKHEKYKIARVFIFIALLFGVWMVRGYIQTGYPLFPSSIGKINFKWTVPEKYVKLERDWIYAGSRSCDRTFDADSPLIKDYIWIDYWIKINVFNKDILSDNFIDNFFIIATLLFFPFTLINYSFGSITLLFLSSIFVLLFLINKGIRIKDHVIVLSLFTVEVFSLLFVVFTAPIPRFFNGIIVIIFITSLLLYKIAYPSFAVNKKIKKILLFYSIAIFIWDFNIAYSANEFAIHGIFVMKKLPMQEFISDYGVKVFIPIRRNIDIYDSYLPASCCVLTNLAFIGDSMSDGFYAKNDGEILWRKDLIKDRMKK